jgi:KDO2-lipid IV(A) lauroyltransferase
MAFMSNSSRFHPRYWPTWFGVGLLWLSVKVLPWSVLRFLGRGLGRLLIVAVPRRRDIARINLDLAFPEKTPEDRANLLRQHFEAVGIGLFEMGLGWWGSEDFLRSVGKIEGLEHLDAAVAKGKGVILLSAHFTTLEITGHILGIERPLHVLYRRNENPIVEHFLKKGRERHAVATIHKDDIRSMIRHLKKADTVWFAFDQNYGGKGSVFSPFFGVPAATNTATSRVSKMTGAAVVPFFASRTATGEYQLSIQKALTDFPAPEEQVDTNRLNRLIEMAVRSAPEQYLWIHRRYRDTPEGTSHYPA